MAAELTDERLTDRLRERARQHLGSELTRSGYALLVSSIITSVLGLAYWFGAARLYDAAELGRGAALVSTMLLVTSLATAGLKRGLIRFIRTAGPGGPRLIGHVYAAGVAFALVFAGLFLAGVGGWVDDLDSLRRGGLGPMVLLVSVGVWAIFVLQDAALIGGRRATVVPASNAVHSVAKIVALVALLVLPVAQDWAVLLSWVVPAAVLAIVVNWWAFHGGLRFEEERSATDPPTVSTVLRFTSAEYVASIFWQGAVYLTPLLVLAQVGATSNAHFYLAFQLAYGVFLVSSNITDALVADAAASQQHLARKVRRASVQIAGILVPAVLILVVFAPQIMGLFGAGYDQAASALRLLAVAGLMNAVTTVMVAVAHVRRRLSTVVAIHVLMSVLTIGLAIELAPSRGITGVAEAWFAAQLVAMVVGGILTVRAEWGHGAAVRHAVALVSEGRSRVTMQLARQTLPAQLAMIPEGVLPDGPSQILSHQHDLTVVKVGTGHRAVVARIASGEEGRTGIAAHAEALSRVHADGRLPSIGFLVPSVIQRDSGGAWLVETVRPGRPVGCVRGAEERTLAVEAALDTLGRLHDASREQVFIGEAELAAWVHDPVASLAAVIGDEHAADGLAAVHRQLVDDLSDRTVTVSACHGDASVDNVLVDDHGRVSGLIDWEASGRGLPELDAYLLLLSRRLAWDGGELGGAMADILRNGWREDEVELLRSSPSWNTHLRPTTLLLLAWLHHAADNLAKTGRYRENGWWLRHNVDGVLAAVADESRTASPDGAGEADSAIGGTVLVGAAAAPSGSSGPMHWLERFVWRADPRWLALVCASLTVVAAVAAWAEAPLVLRIPLILAAMLVAPALMVGRHLGGLVGAGRLLLGSFAAVSLVVLLAEVLLYAHLWRPGLLLVLVGSATVVTAVLAPEEVRPDVADLD